MPSNKSHDNCEEPMPHSVPRGFLRFLIMSLLRKDELTGTEIMDILEERSDGLWKPSPGSIYPLLDSLRQDEMIDVVSEVGRSKKYRISDEGLQHFKKMAKRKGDFDHKTSLSRVLWLHLLSPTDRMHFHLSGIRVALEFIEESIDDISPSEQKKVRQRLKKLADRLATIADAK